MQAAGTPQPRHHPAAEPIGALGGIKPVAMQALGNLGQAEAIAAWGGDPVDERRVMRQVVRPRARSNHVMPTAHPPRPVARDLDLCTLAWDLDGDARDPHTHPLLSVRRAGRRRAPPSWDVLGSRPERLTLTGCQLRGLCPLEPRLRFLLLWLLAQGLFPAAFQRTRHHAVCRFDGRIRPSRPLRTVARPLDAWLPLRLEWRALRSQGVFSSQADCSRRRWQPRPALLHDHTLETGAGQAHTWRCPVIHHTSAARVAEAPVLATRGGHQAPPAPPTDHQTTPPRGPLTWGPQRRGHGAVIRSALVDRRQALPTARGRKPIVDQHGARLGGIDGATGASAARLWPARVRLARAPAVRPRRDRLVQPVVPGQARGTPPLQRPPVQTPMGPNRHAHVVGHQRAQPAMQAALPLEGIKEPSNHPLGRLIRGQLVIPLGAAYLAPGRVIQHGPALGLVPHALPPAAFQHVPCRCAPHATAPQPETVVVVRRILEAISIGPSGPQHRPEFEPVVPVLVRAGQATHRQSEDEPHMVHADLGQQALKAHACHHALAALALILSTAADTLT
jgi:hypothetical protein